VHLARCRLREIERPTAGKCRKNGGREEDSEVR